MSAPEGAPFCFRDSIQGRRAARFAPGYFISRLQREEQRRMTFLSGQVAIC
jgi:hypothetical protein